MHALFYVLDLQPGARTLSAAFWTLNTSPASPVPATFLVATWVAPSLLIFSSFFLLVLLLLFVVGAAVVAVWPVWLLKLHLLRTTSIHSVTFTEW